MGYSLFVEQQTFEGSTSRPTQQTVPISAQSDLEAVDKAYDYAQHLFDGAPELGGLRAHVQRDDGSLIKEIVLSRPMKSHD